MNIDFQEELIEDQKLFASQAVEEQNKKVPKQDLAEPIEANAQDSLLESAKSALVGLFTEEALSVITLADLGKPLSEILAKLTKSNTKEQDIQDNPWTFTDKDNVYQGERIIKLDEENTLEKVKGKLIDIKSEDLATVFLESDSKTIEYKFSEGEIKVVIRTDKEEELKGAAADIDNELTKVLKLSDADDTTFFTDSSTEMYCFSDDKDYLLKIPIAMPGKWKHPVLKQVQFTEEDVKILEKNYLNDELGYNVPLYIGHHLTDGAPKEGELIRTEFVNNILYGYWKVNKDVYRQVEDGRFTYSSAEIYPNYKSKKTGESIGKTLCGMALTNRPFIPNLPKVVALSERSEQTEEVEWFTKPTILAQHDYNKSEQQTLAETTMNQTDKSSQEQAPEVLMLSEQIDQLQKQVTAYETKLQLAEEAYQAQIKLAEEKNSLLESRIQKYEDRIKQEELDKKVLFLSELTLPQDIKDKYISLVKEQKLGDVEDVVLQSLSDLAKSFMGTIGGQIGMSVSTANMNDQDYKDVYSDVIAHNQKLAEQKRAQVLGY